VSLDLSEFQELDVVAVGIGHGRNQASPVFAHRSANDSRSEGDSDVECLPDVGRGKVEHHPLWFHGLAGDGAVECHGESEIGPLETHESFSGRSHVIPEQAGVEVAQCGEPLGGRGHDGTGEYHAIEPITPSTSAGEGDL